MDLKTDILNKNQSLAELIAKVGYMLAYAVGKVNQWMKAFIEKYLMEDSQTLLEQHKEHRSVKYF